MIETFHSYIACGTYIKSTTHKVVVIHSYSVVSEMTGRRMGTGRYAKHIFHFGSYRSVETPTGVISNVIDLFQERFTAPRWVSGMQHTLYLLVRSVNCILFTFSTSIKILFDSRQVEYVHVHWTNECLSVRPTVAVQLVAHLLSSIEVRVSNFGPELAILSEPIVIFLIIQVNTVVVFQYMPRLLPSTSSQVTHLRLSVMSYRRRR